MGMIWTTDIDTSDPIGQFFHLICTIILDTGRRRICDSSVIRWFRRGGRRRFRKCSGSGCVGRCWYIIILGLHIIQS